MARVNVTVLNANKNSGAGVDLTASAVAADATNDHSLLNRTRGILLLVWTAAGASVDIDFDSVADPYGRLGGSSEEGPTSIAASKFYAFGPFTPALFSQKSGTYKDYVQVNLANLVGTVNLVGLAVS